jgi:chromosomal replication initiation ATPase DnaA
MNLSAHSQQIASLTLRVAILESCVQTLQAERNRAERNRVDRLAEKRIGQANPVRALLVDAAQLWDLNVGMICGLSRQSLLFQARAAICYAATSLYGTPSTIIGHVLGDREQSTIRAATKRGAQLYRESRSFKALVDHLSACDAERNTL